MGLPTHHTELAVWQGVRGCAVKSFLTPKKDFLIHGNELLGGFLDDYDTEKSAASPIIPLKISWA